MKTNYSLKELDTIASHIIEKATSKTLIFNGEMGVGKTTLIKVLVKQLGCKDVVNSPTFSIVNEYEINNSDTLVYHFDLYRLNDIEEAYNFGIEDYLYSNHWVIIEWPDVINDLIPVPHDIIDLFIEDNSTRSIKITSVNA